jgi:predicted  nucleic acid-binding Zn-ribbon protein
LNSSTNPAAGNAPAVAISWGELIDKITILEIKQQRLNSPPAVANVRTELAALSRIVMDLKSAPAGLEGLKQQLKSVNEKLWEIEDRIRAKEAEKAFDRQFIELARSVYFNNDERSRIKREINALLKSGVVEEKQYTAYKT